MEGSQAYYDSLFALYAQWGVDYVKCDDICNTSLYRENQYSAAHEIEMLHAAIEKCGRPIVLSLSPGPALIEKAWHYEKYANMWRITDDFWDNWELLKNMFYRCELWQDHVKAGLLPGLRHAAPRHGGKGLFRGAFHQVHEGGAGDDDDPLVHLPFPSDGGRGADEAG